MCETPTRSRRAGSMRLPRWGLLYGLVSLPLTALSAVQILLAPGALRTMAGCGLVLLVFAAMALWVRLNRSALDQQDWCDCAWDKVTVRVIQSGRPAPATVPSPPRHEAVEEEEEEAWAVSSARR